jgi:hypothetical protein
MRRLSKILATLATLACTCVVPIAGAQSIPGYVYSSPLLPLVLQMPENTWIKANVNLYSDVWTPPDLEPLDIEGVTHTPAKIIRAWSSFAWDSNRGDLILYGGGHMNYDGNDVYRWHSGNLRWERASLPSEMVYDPLTSFNPVDGVDFAPDSAHTFDNNIFLPIADRFLTWGGAAYNIGGPFVRRDEANPSQMRVVGPYLFDPNRADGNKVGGSTGSHVKRVAPHPEIVGGYMWENRDLHKYFPTIPNLPGRHANGCTGYASEGGRDVVYVAGFTGMYGNLLNLWRYQLTDVANPLLDQITQVGAYNVSVSGTITCGYDPVRRLFVRTGTNAIPFVFWDLTTASPTNPDKQVQVDSTIAGFQSWLAGRSLNIQNCALEFDPMRGTFPVWCGAGVVWELRPPASNTVTGWTIVQRSLPAGVVPPGDTGGTGVLGKWHYAPYYDVWVGLEDYNEGHIWIWKPIGWKQPNPPGNALPSVSVTSPAPGSTLVPGAHVDLTASASDADGSIARVEYYVNGAKVGSATAAPYTVTIAPILVGSYSVVAVAVDNVGGMARSTGVTFTVNASLSTAVLQRGQAGYNGVADTFLDPGAPTVSRGSYNPLYLYANGYTPLVRFAIFQSEGGPVPHGAVLQSATLALYKGVNDDVVTLNALLKPWTEAEATWNVSKAGTAWSVPGARGAGADYVASADAVANAPYNAGWVTFDVTDRVQQWGDGIGVNNGWRLASGGSNPGNKTFNASEYTADPTLRPKLTIVYSLGSNPPPTVSIASPADGTSVAVGSSVAIAANASDDSAVASVQFLVNGSAIATDATAPYGVNWTPTAAGTYTLTAIATDNSGARTTSAPIRVTAGVAGGTSVVLQRGLNGYAGAADTFLDPYASRTARGSYNPLYLYANAYTPLVRFAIFESEGGPVPDGSSITSATLQLYKQYYDDTLRLNALLKPWTESQATWLTSQGTTSWTSPGAAAAGSDYASAADALVGVGYSPGWVSFDVTRRVQAWSGGGSNYGWRLASTGTNSGNKTFNASEYTADPALRPKLTVVYVAGTRNTPPTVSITSPASGASVAVGSSVAISASASDSNGIASVQFLVNGTPVGTDSTAPYSVSWTPPAAGSYTLTAVATDNAGGKATSAAIAVTAGVASGTSVVLQRGLNGYAGAADTFLDPYNTSTARGAYNPLYLYANGYTPLVRFAIFQSEGGPIPDSATIDSATLELYKQYYDDTLRLNALLKPWAESQATWFVSQAGSTWSAAGAAGAGTDYATTADATVSAGFNPGWVSFDVTRRVQAWSAGSGNYGWRLASTGTSAGNKTFNASEYTANATLRPRLTVRYH